ncbi:MAG: Octanoyltransferase LipM [Acidimicrobiales bacterium]|nr:MAG: lipoate--protein ligase family protein [Actinomycetota bacterium]MBV6508760.1 Octanoyltransferase LipM [Acidimicrobiales bacterium]RIK06504.1 MAG: hypothetical protein DCC48_06200 [Acidobacteriota bacterium]
MEWSIRRLSGRAAGLHRVEHPEGSGRQVQVMDFEDGAVVLGSTQTPDLLDRSGVRAGGFDVVRRRSGGGVVLLVPGQTLWVDFLVPAGDPLWSEDVGRSFLWLGRLWASALDHLGVKAVLGAGSTPDDLGRLVCFAAVHPGEITVGGRKVVGFSQRRTRSGSRFQSAALLRWDPDELLHVLDERQVRRVTETVIPGGGGDARSLLVDRVGALGLEAAELVSALCSQLPI